MAKKNNGYTLDDDADDILDSSGDDMTEMGKMLWENIAKRQMMEEALPGLIARVKRLPVNTFELQLKNMQLEVKKMIKHSENVISECNEIIATFTDEKQYLASDAKIAKTLNERLITRLKRLYDGVTVFDHHIEVEPEKEIVFNTAYYKPAKT